MRKLLLWLLGLLLMGVLAYFCFMDKREGIKEAILTNTQERLAGEQMDWVHADLKGDDFEMSRVVTLEGNAPSIELKKKAGLLAAGVAGVLGVQNNLQVADEVVVGVEQEEMMTPEVARLKEVAAVTPVSPAMVAEVAVPSPYTLQVVKNKSGIVTLTGYVPSEEVHANIMNKATETFGKDNVIDQLKEIKGAPEDWDATATLGVTNLSMVEYGELSMSDYDYGFKGYVSQADEKASLLDGFKEKLDSAFPAYHSHYAIDAPEVKVADVEEVAQAPINVALSCQEKIHELLSQEKIHFNYNKSGIKPESFNILDAIADVAKSCPSDVLLIGGHTDSIGNKDYNQKLSERRATSVKKYLVSKGLNADRLEAVGYGESMPIASNMEKPGRAINRRIEISIKGVTK